MNIKAVSVFQILCTMKFEREEIQWGIDNEEGWKEGWSWTMPLTLKATIGRKIKFEKNENGYVK